MPHALSVAALQPDALLRVLVARHKAITAAPGKEEPPADFDLCYTAPATRHRGAPPRAADCLSSRPQSATPPSASPPERPPWKTGKASRPRSAALACPGSAFPAQATPVARVPPSAIESVRPSPRSPNGKLQLAPPLNPRAGLVCTEGDGLMSPPDVPHDLINPLDIPHDTEGKDGSGGACSLIARSRGMLVPDYGALRNEARAQKSMCMVVAKWSGMPNQHHQADVLIAPRKQEIDAIPFRRPDSASSAGRRASDAGRRASTASRRESKQRGSTATRLSLYLDSYVRGSKHSPAPPEDTDDDEDESLIDQQSALAKTISSSFKSTAEKAAIEKEIVFKRAASQEQQPSSPTRPEKKYIAVGAGGAGYWRRQNTRCDALASMARRPGARWSAPFSRKPTKRLSDLAEVPEGHDK